MSVENAITILSSVKSALPIEDSIDDYDHDLLNYINASIFRINTAIPTEFELVFVDENTTLDSIFNTEAIIPEKIKNVYNIIQTLIILYTRNFFNPSKSSSVQKIYDESIKEFQFSLTAMLEAALWRTTDGE